MQPEPPPPPTDQTRLDATRSMSTLAQTSHNRAGSVNRSALADDEYRRRMAARSRRFLKKSDAKHVVGGPHVRGPLEKHDENQ